LSLGQVPDGSYVVDDSDDDRLGPVVGDLAMFYVEIAGEPHIVFSAVIGEAEGAVDRVDLEFPDGVEPCRVRNGAWMSFPKAFIEGMRVTATWRDLDGNALREFTTGPLKRRDLQPHRDADWLGYAPA
jgi:hypothetical protein